MTRWRLLPIAIGLLLLVLAYVGMEVLRTPGYPG